MCVPVEATARNRPKAEEKGPETKQAEPMALVLEMQEIGEAGITVSPLALIRKHGFDGGMHVQKRGDPDMYIIT